jgi:hypothetical protein
MRKLSLLLGSTVILALVSPAIGQYVPPPPGVWVPQNPAPPPVDTSPRYRQQEPQRPQSNDNSVQDTRRREQQQRSLNETAGRRASDPGECAVGMSEETCRRRGQEYIPPRKD